MTADGVCLTYVLGKNGDDDGDRSSAGSEKKLTIQDYWRNCGRMGSVGKTANRREELTPSRTTKDFWWSSTG